DLVIMHSVAQYLTGEELDTVLALFRRLVKPDGMLVLGDVIDPKTSAASDALALLRFGARDGFFFAALIGLARTVLSSYWRLRSSLGLTRYDEAAMIAKLAGAGFSAPRAGGKNGHSRPRTTLPALPAGSAARGCGRCSAGGRGERRQRRHRLRVSINKSFPGSDKGRARTTWYKPDGPVAERRRRGRARPPSLVRIQAGPPIAPDAVGRWAGCFAPRPFFSCG